MQAFPKLEYKGIEMRLWIRIFLLGDKNHRKWFRDSVSDSRIYFGRAWFKKFKGNVFYDASISQASSAEIEMRSWAEFFC